jgi:enterochelin esterase-like enzyme
MTPWLERDRLLDGALSQRGIAHTWRVMPGGHEGAYWITNSSAYLRFYSAAMR